MRRAKTLLLGMCLVLGLAGGAGAVTKTATWTWPTTRTDGTTLPLSSIANGIVYDTSVPSPGLPGTAVPCTLVTPFTATASCTVNVTTGHSFVMTVVTNDSPAETSGVSNSITVPFAAPSAVSNFNLQ